MKSKIKDVKVIYPDNPEELKRWLTKVIAKVIVGRIGDENIGDFIEKLKEQNTDLLF
jgi:hypothetical protein